MPSSPIDSPTFTNAALNFAVGATSRMSAASASASPPPVAGPWIAAITGNGRCRIAWMPPVAVSWNFEELAHAHLGDHVDLVEVEAGAEGALAGPGEDERAQPAVAQRAGGHAVLGEHPDGLGVHPLGPVDPQDADAGLGHLEGQGLQLGEVRGRGHGRRHPVRLR